MKPDGRTIFGRNVVRLRVAAEMTQEDLSGKAGCERSYLQDIERGDANLSLKKILALRRGLGCSMDGLMRGVVEADDEWFREVCMTEAAANGREPVPVP